MQTRKRLAGNFALGFSDWGIASPLIPREPPGAHHSARRRGLRKAAPSGAVRRTLASEHRSGTYRNAGGPLWQDERRIPLMGLEYRLPARSPGKSFMDGVFIR